MDIFNPNEEHCTGGFSSPPLMIGRISRLYAATDLMVSGEHKRIEIHGDLCRRQKIEVAETELL
jgi:hypothetical protein